jgi:hypothetical protein
VTMKKIASQKKSMQKALEMLAMCTTSAEVLFAASHLSLSVSRRVVTAATLIPQGSSEAVAATQMHVYAGVTMTWMHGLLVSQTQLVMSTAK